MVLALSGELEIILSNEREYLPTYLGLRRRVTALTPCILHRIPDLGLQGDTKTVEQGATAACTRIFLEGRLTDPPRRMT
jgi:hypothetical protein